MRKIYILVSITLILLILTSIVAFKPINQKVVPSLGKISGSPSQTILNINNITSWIRSDAKFHWVVGGNWNGTFPKGTAGAIFAEGVLWGGFVRDGKSPALRVNGSTYSTGTIAGAIKGIRTGEVESPDASDVRIWRVRPDYKTADLTSDAEQTLSTVGDVKSQYEKDWTEWPANKGAPFEDKNGDGKYDPNVDIPGIPGASQTVWFVANDIGAQGSYGSPPIGMELQMTLWGYAFPSSRPLGNMSFKQVRLIYKGTKDTPANAKIEDCYISQWADPDLGDYGDDYSGCDTTLSLGYIYNSSLTDAIYGGKGLAVPAVGYDFLQGPFLKGKAGEDRNKNGVDDSKDYGIFNLKKRGPGFINLPMTSFLYFYAGGEDSDPSLGSYEGTLQWYNLMLGLRPRPSYPNGLPWTDPTQNNKTTKFPLYGDPVKKTGWYDGIKAPPADRRLGLSSGPFTMALGDTQEVVLALVGGIGSDALSSVTVLKSNDALAQFAYDQLFNIAKPPEPPNVKVGELDKQVVLEWGSDRNAVKKTEETIQKGGSGSQGTRFNFRFEGYNIYQFPTSTPDFKKAVKVTTFDLVDGVKAIIDETVDASGQTVTYTAQNSGDVGIKRSFVITQDLIRNKPLSNGITYYFAVTAYSVADSNYDGKVEKNPIAATLESPAVVLSVTPQSPKPGISYPLAANQSLTVTHKSGKSDGKAEITIVDPTVTTGKDYKVTFKNINTTFTYGPDSKGNTDKVTVPILNWYVVKGSDTLFNGVNQGPDVIIDPGTHNLAEEFPSKSGDNFEYPIIEGFFIKVSGPPPLINATRTEFTGTNWWTGNIGQTAVGGFSLGGPGAKKLSNMATTAYDMTNYLGAVGSKLDPSEYVDIEFRFKAGGSLKQKAYQYSRAASAIETGSQYKYLGYVDVPFQVWDISDSKNPRQLNVAWRDQNRNGKWEPNQDLEIIFVAKSAYDGDTPKTYGTTVGSSANNLVNSARGTGGDVMYIAEWWTGAGGPGEEGIKESTIHISPNYVNSANDAFEFTPQAPTYNDKAAKADVEKINVVPNPYYGVHEYEKSRLDKYVKITHLPKKATIRIFNMAGVLVNVIQKNDDLQFTNWNLTNYKNLPVASGIYIIHIDMPDLKKQKILKLAVVQEEQILPNY